MTARAAAVRRTGAAWRVAGAAAVAVAAAAHVAALDDHAHEAPALAAAFALFTVACLAAAVGLLVRGTARTWAVSAGVCGAALVAYALSRTVGLPGASSHHAHSWTDRLGVLSMAGESAVLLLAAGAVLSLRRRPAAVPVRAAPARRRAVR